MSDIYIAAPFFNEPQRALVGKIEALLDQLNWPYFSPRLQHYNKSETGIHDLEHARRVFWKNYTAIQDAHLVLAVADWALPVGVELHLLTRCLNLTKSQQALCLEVLCNRYVGQLKLNTGWKDLRTDETIPPAGPLACQDIVLPPNLVARHFAGPLTIPDTGTVWECGYAFGIGLPVVLYTSSEKASVNLMLSICARGILYGPSKLEKFFATEEETDRKVDWTACAQWKGGFR